MDRLDWVRILPPWLFPAMATLVGLLMGSFANVCIHRMPQHLSVVWARSACPSCGAGVRGYDNIPLLSWLILRGRCRDCQAPIAACAGERVRLAARVPPGEVRTGMDEVLVPDGEEHRLITPQQSKQPAIMPKQEGPKGEAAIPAQDRDDQCLRQTVGHETLARCHA